MRCKEEKPRNRKVLFSASPVAENSRAEIAPKEIQFDITTAIY